MPYCRAARAPARDSAPLPFQAVPIIAPKNSPRLCYCLSPQKPTDSFPLVAAIATLCENHITVLLTEWLSASVHPTVVVLHSATLNIHASQMHSLLIHALLLKSPIPEHRIVHLEHPDLIYQRVSTYYPCSLSLRMLQD